MHLRNLGEKRWGEFFHRKTENFTRRFPVHGPFIHIPNDVAIIRAVPLFCDYSIPI